MKLLPKALLLSVFAVPIGLFSALLAVSLIVCPPKLDLNVVGMILAMLVINLFLFFPFGRMLQRLLRPEELRVDAQGVTLISRGRERCHVWFELGEPRVLYSRGGSVLSLELPHRRGEKPLRIGAQDYPYAVADILRVFENAKLGDPGAMPPEKSLAVDRYFNLPIAFLTACILPALMIYLYTG